MITKKAGVWPPVEKVKRPVWVGQEVTCTACGFEGSLQEGDNVTIDSQARSPEGPVNISLTCPTAGCSRTIHKQFRISLSGSGLCGAMRETG